MSKPLKITLDENDFKTLVSGDEVVTHAREREVHIVFSNIDYGAMLKIVKDSMDGENI